MKNARAAQSTLPTSQHENRQDVRGLEAPPGVRCEVIGLDLPLVLNEVGTGGFSVQASRPFHTDVIHVFRFTFQDGESALISAEARHTRSMLPPSGDSFVYVTGFAFRGLERPEVQRSVDALIDRTLSALQVE
jgi:hypothetical protein